LGAGREKDYLRHCLDIEKRLNALAAPDILHTRAARLLSLRAGGFADGEKLLVAAAQIAENSSEWWLVHPQVPLLYRLGRYDQALREARRIDLTRLYNQHHAPLHSWKALILWRLNRRQEAREALALAKRYVEDTRDLRGLTEGDTDVVIEAEIALREAESLVTADAVD
jgi:tetratricopeptide (TPR) repeat protein